MANVGTLSIKFTGDARQLEKTFTKILVKSDLMSKGMESAFLAVTGAARKLASDTLNLAASNENTLTSFQNLTGSITEAKDLYEDLINFSSTTPFSFSQITEGTQTLLGFGLSADDASQALKDLGAAAASNADTDLKRLVVSYGQIQGANVAMTRDLREFVNNGIPIYQLLSDTLDVSTSKINEMASAGQITGDVIARVFREAASEGGRFSNTLLTQSQTLTGLVSTMKDNYAITLGRIGEKLLPAAKEAAIGFNDVLLDMQDYFESNEGEEWAIRLAASIKAGFESASTEIQLLVNKAQLATAEFFEDFFEKSAGLANSKLGFLFSDEDVANSNNNLAEASAKVEDLKSKIEDLEGSGNTFSEAYQRAIEEIEFDQMLKQLEDMVQILENPVSGGGSGGGVLEDEKQKAHELARALYLADQALQNTIDSFRETEAVLSPVDITSGDVISDQEFKAKFTGIETTDSLSDVPEINAKALALEQQARAEERVAAAMQLTSQVASTYGSKLAQAYQEGQTGARAYASAAVEAAKEIIAAQIREGVITAATKALAEVPFPANIILAGVAAGAAEALFRGLVSKIKIPAFGDGGVVYGPTLALIGEKGPEEIVPLGRGKRDRGVRVQVRGVDYGSDRYWSNANVNALGSLIYGG